MSSSSEAVANDLKGVTAAFLLNTAISTGLLLAFSILRPRHKVIYQPRLKFADNKKKPLPLKDSVMSWIKVIISFKAEDQVDKIGLDAVMFLLFVKLCLNIFGLLAAIAVPLCVFHYFSPSITGQSKNNINVDFNPQLTSLGMTNVSADSGWYFLHISLVWVISFYAYFELWKSWKKYQWLRVWWISTDEFKNSVHQRTLLITKVPESLKSEQNLSRYLKKENISQKLCQVAMGRQVNELPDLVEDYENTINLLETALVKFREKNKDRPTHRENGYFFGLIRGEKVDSIDFYSQKLEKLEAEIYSIRSKGDAQYEKDHSAFVFFDELRDAHRAALKAKAKSFMLNPISRPKIRVSPAFQDIIWKNIGISPAVRNTRFYLALIFLIALTIGWTSLISLVSSVATIDSIAKYNQGLASFILNNTALSIFVQHILGPLLLAILNFILPIILFRVAFLQGVCSGIGSEKSVLNKQFFFSVYQIVIMLVFAPLIESILAVFKGEQFKVGSNEPFYQMIMRLAAVGFVKNAAYFTSYVVTNVTGYAIDIIQGAPLFLNFFQRKFFVMTPRKQHELNQPPKFDYTRTYGQILLILLIGFSYTVVAPIMMPFIFFYFFIVFLIMKYQLFYVYETKIETGGTWWPKIWKLMTLCLFFGQIIFMCIIILFSATRTSSNYSTIQTALVVALPIITILYWFIMSRTIVKRCEFSIFGKSEDGSEDTLVQTPFSSSSKASLLSTSHSAIQHPALVKPLVSPWLPENKEFPNHFESQYRDTDNYMLRRRLAASKPIVAADSMSATQSSLVGNNGLYVGANNMEKNNIAGLTSNGSSVSPIEFAPQPLNTHVHRLQHAPSFTSLNHNPYYHHQAYTQRPLAHSQSSSTLNNSEYSYVAYSPDTVLHHQNSPNTYIVASPPQLSSARQNQFMNDPQPPQAPQQ